VARISGTICQGAAAQFHVSELSDIRGAADQGCRDKFGWFRGDLINIDGARRQRSPVDKTGFEGGMEFAKELWLFLRVRKKFWLGPIIIMMVILALLLVFAQSSVLAPFIYTIF
jgi:hypothetical protein